MLSEEALECLHKTIRKNRLEHTRKNSRENSNRDLMSKLLISSDPLVTTNRITLKTSNRINNYDEISHLILDDNEEIFSH